jgi:hypothetical protein
MRHDLKRRLYGLAYRITMGTGVVLALGTGAFHCDCGGFGSAAGRRMALSCRNDSISRIGMGKLLENGKWKDLAEVASNARNPTLRKETLFTLARAGRWDELVSIATGPNRGEGNELAKAAVAELAMADRAKELNSVANKRKNDEVGKMAARALQENEMKMFKQWIVNPGLKVSSAFAGAFAPLDILENHLDSLIVHRNRYGLMNVADNSKDEKKRKTAIAALESFAEDDLENAKGGIGNYLERTESIGYTPVVGSKNFDDQVRASISGHYMQAYRFEPIENSIAAAKFLKDPAIGLRVVAMFAGKKTESPRAEGKKMAVLRNISDNARSPEVRNAAQKAVKDPLKAGNTHR